MTTLQTTPQRTPPKTIAVVLWLIAVFPVGLWILWTHPTWSLKTKQCWTAGWAALVLVSLIYQASPSVQADHAAQQKADAAAQAQQEASRVAQAKANATDKAAANRPMPKPQPALFSTSPIATRIPFPLRQVLYQKFMAAADKASQEGETMYPTPNSGDRPYQEIPKAEYFKYMDIQSSYTDKLTERYESSIRRAYGVNSHEEDLIETEGAEKEWPN